MRGSRLQELTIVDTIDCPVPRSHQSWRPADGDRSSLRVVFQARSRAYGCFADGSPQERTGGVTGRCQSSKDVGRAGSYEGVGRRYLARSASLTRIPSTTVLASSWAP